MRPAILRAAPFDCQCGSSVRRTTRLRLANQASRALEQSASRRRARGSATKLSRRQQQKADRRQEPAVQRPRGVRWTATVSRRSSPPPIGSAPSSFGTVASPQLLFPVCPRSGFATCDRRRPVAAIPIFLITAKEGSHQPRALRRHTPRPTPMQPARPAAWCKGGVDRMRRQQLGKGDFVNVNYGSPSPPAARAYPLRDQFGAAAGLLRGAGVLR
jgi:hypothetical protein